jgi:hypothetical protein
VFNPVISTISEFTRGTVLASDLPYSACGPSARLRPHDPYSIPRRYIKEDLVLTIAHNLVIEESDNLVTALEDGADLIALKVISQFSFQRFLSEHSQSRQELSVTFGKVDRGDVSANSESARVVNHPQSPVGRDQQILEIAVGVKD